MYQQFRAKLVQKIISDTGLALSFFLLSGLVAYFFYEKIDYTFFYQNFSPESILWACNLPFNHPINPISELLPFIDGQAKKFDCSTLKNIGLHNTTSVFTRGTPYLTWSTAILWRIFGVSYQSLAPLIILLFGLYASGIFLLLRQFFNKIPSSLATLFLCCSPIATHMIGNLRDFSKGPFIIWAIYFLLKSIQGERNTSRLLYPCLAGLTAGFGLGFRSDLFFLIPIGSLFLMLGYSEPINPKLKWVILCKVKVVFIFIISFLLMGYPVLKNKNGSPGGLGGAFIMQGMTEPFRNELKLSSAGYSTGWTYSDELTFSAIAAEERIKNPNLDEVELKGVSGITTSPINYLGTSQLMNWGYLFIGDFATQAIKSTYWILAFPSYISNSDFYPNIPYTHTTPQKIILKIYKSTPQFFISFVLLFGFVIFIFNSFVRYKYRGFSIAFLFLFLTAYPAIQFNIRHFFHLEFIWVICLLSILSIPSILKYQKKQFAYFLFSSLLALILGISLYIGMIKFQQYEISNEIKKLLSLPREEVLLQKVIGETGKVVFSVPVPEEYKSIVNAKFDSMTPEMGYKGGQWDIRSAASRYLLTVSGEHCSYVDIDVGLNYAHTKGTWQPLDTVFKIPKHLQNEGTLLFPGFYRATQFFNGISVPLKFADCKFKLEKIQGTSKIPFVFSTTIINGQISGPLNKGL